MPTPLPASAVVPVRFESASSEFTAAVHIDAPLQRAWAVMSDVDRWHEWTPSITRITRRGGAPLAAGTRLLIRPSLTCA